LINKEEELLEINFQFKHYREDIKIKIEDYKKDIEEIKVENLGLKSEL
jgi:hypothetical protein